MYQYQQTEMSRKIQQKLKHVGFALRYNESETRNYYHHHHHHHRHQ